MKILIVIPARGGSKGVKKKNLRKINGKSLIRRACEVANNSKYIDFIRVCLSSDDTEMIKEGISYGAEAPFVRPSDISEDVETELVIEHAYNFYKDIENYEADLICLLQPTTPFRTSTSLDKAIKFILENKKIDSVFTAKSVDGMNPEKMFRSLGENTIEPYTNSFLDNEGVPYLKLVARQDCERLFIPDGNLFIVKSNYFKRTMSMLSRNSYFFETDEKESLDIDTEQDILFADFLETQNK